MKVHMRRPAGQSLGSRQQPGPQAIAGDRDQLQRVMAAVRFALFKIAVDASHLICDMGKTQDRLLSDLRERVKRCGFHLDSKNSCPRRGIDRLLGFAEWRIGRPGGADLHGDSPGGECLARKLGQVSICLAVIRRRQVMVAGALVAQRAIDDDEVWW